MRVGNPLVPGEHVFMFDRALLDAVQRQLAAQASAVGRARPSARPPSCPASPAASAAPP